MLEAVSCLARRGVGAAVTESGAFKALTLDLCEQVGLALPALNDTNAPALRAAMPAFVPVSNPLDLPALADLIARLGQVLDALMVIRRPEP